LRGSEKEPRLPPGYWLDSSDPDAWALRRAEGWVVAYFSAQSAATEAIEQAAWEDHEGGEKYP
jgi:alkanesulfonate monooxygenase SsuD/methylene tetrahydromethanopterin reductase-like flavin-dependent oxidoreductase (luciferase family)